MYEFVKFVNEFVNNEHDRYMILDMILDCETHQAGPTVVVFTNPGKGQFESSLTCGYTKYFRYNLSLYIIF